MQKNLTVQKLKHASPTKQKQKQKQKQHNKRRTAQRAQGAEAEPHGLRAHSAHKARQKADKLLAACVCLPLLP